MIALARRALFSSRLWFALALLGLTACEQGHEFTVGQRSTVPMPGFEGKLRVSVGDIKRGERAAVRVIGPDQQDLASKSAARSGQTLPFEFEGKAYTLRVTGYVDHTFGTDEARLKLIGLSEEQLASAAGPPEPSAPAPAAGEPAQQSSSSSAPQAPTSPELGLAVLPGPLESGDTSCGTSQPTLQERIADCEKKQVDTTLGESPKDGGAASWQLVTRTASGLKVWLQVSTGKLWSDRLGKERMDLVGWCRAKGEVSASGAGRCVPTRSPAAGAPAFAYAQLQPPESWCAEQAEFITPTRFDEAKGGMRRTATKHSPSVTWAMPTVDEWNAAKADGGEAVLPHGQDPLFWPASLAKHGVMSLLSTAVAARGNLSPEQAANASVVGPVLALRCIGTPSP